MYRRYLKQGSITLFFCLLILLYFSSNSSVALVQGRYSSWMKNLIKTSDYQKLNSMTGGTETAPVQMNCLETPGSRFYIGVSQKMTIKAPLEEVSKVIEDIDHYSELFPGYAAVKILSRNGNEIHTAWEQEIPVFFIPNVKYQMDYEISQPSADTRIYEYSLVTAGKVRESDGFIAVSRLPDQTTQYLELDFFDADWGPLETFAPGKIWPESINGIFISDVAIKMKAENPQMTPSQARQASENTAKTLEKTLKDSPGEFCSNHKTTLWQERLNGLKRP
jgi:hypothetical protein